MTTLAIPKTSMDLPQAFGHVRSSSDSNLLERRNYFDDKDYEDNIPDDLLYGDGPETEDRPLEPEKTESDQDTDSDLQDLAGEFRSRLNSRGHHASITDRLHEELTKAKEALELKDEQVSKLTRVREEMDQEITELTARLFEEAHIMVNESNVKRAKAEKKLKEATGKIDVLQAEVQALKMLVLTSTPSKPNPQSNDSKKRSILSKKSKNHVSVNVFSHHRNHSLQGPITMELADQPTNGDQAVSPEPESPKRGESDPVLLREFQAWKEHPTFSREDPFLSRIFSEDVFPCLKFPNQKLSEMLQACVEDFSLCIEPLPDKGSLRVPRRCSLTEQQRACHYRIKLGDAQDWINICPAARNRITAVCDFYTYLHYIKQGLVKSDLQEIYWEMIRLRRQMSLTKLGLQ